MASLKFDITKFDRTTSFTLWQVKMRAILAQSGLHVALQGKDNLEGTEKQKADADYKALAMIQLSLSDEVLREVVHEKTAADLWQKLEALYLTKSITSKIVLKQKLHLLRMSESTPLKEHLDTFLSIIMDLENMDVKIDEEDKAIVLLCSLPPSYSAFRDSISYGKSAITLEEVKSALFSKELMDKELSARSSSGQMEALSTSGRFKHKDLICNYCKKKGHIKANCYKLKNKQQAQQQDQIKKEQSAEASYVDTFETEVLTVSEGSCPRHQWLLDSGCSYHMTPYRDWFSSYDSIEGGVVLLGNNVSCKVFGIGSVKIKMHDGIIRTLTNVWHVPDLKRNLISLSALDSFGYSFSGQSGVLKVTKGTFVVMKAEKIGKLYVLQGSTVTDQVAVNSDFLSKLQRLRLKQNSWTSR